MGVTVVRPGAAARSQFKFVPVEGGALLVGAVPENSKGDSTIASNCPAPDMAARTPFGTGVVALVVSCDGACTWRLVIRTGFNVIGGTR